MLPDSSTLSRWSWALTCGAVFVVGTLFGLWGGCWISGCAAGLPEPAIVEVTSGCRADAGR